MIGENVENILNDLVVVKRSGQRVEFNGTKIAVAIKKAFDQVRPLNSESSINKVFADVFNTLIFDGEQIITADELQSASVQSQYKAEDGILHEQERDVVKRWNKNGFTLSILELLQIFL